MAERPQADERDPSESLGHELVLYGNEQMIQGSDNVTLVAFAALAYQQIRGQGELHHNLGCGLLLVSVLLCAVVHFTIGNAYVSRGKKMLSQGRERRRSRLTRRFFFTISVSAAILQFVLVLLGVGLVLMPREAPAWLNQYVLRHFAHEIAGGPPAAVPLPAGAEAPPAAEAPVDAPAPPSS
jgi:ABC-type Fe3+ transport system permease subunit